MSFVSMVSLVLLVSLVSAFFGVYQVTKVICHLFGEDILGFWVLKGGSIGYNSFLIFYSWLGHAKAHSYFRYLWHFYGRYRGVGKAGGVSGHGL